MEEFSENMKLLTVIRMLSMQDRYITQCQLSINGHVSHKRILFMQGRRRTDIIAVCEDVSDIPERKETGKHREGNVANSEDTAYLMHEIRILIHSICGKLDLLQREEGYRGNEYLENAVLASAHLKELVNASLCVSMAEDARSVMKLETVTMEELMRYPESVLGQEAEKKRIRLELLAGEPIYQYLYLNKMVVCQIMVNLISNAIKYTKEGGNVTCRMTENYLEEKRVRLSIEITDTGIGMEEGFLSVIWEDYTRECREKDAQGSGLGLALTKRLVEFLSGTIEINSQIGCGTKVLVEFEADADDARYDLPRMPHLPSGPGKPWREPFKRALVAEDEESNMEIIGRYLQELGIAVDKTYDGEEVIAIFAQSEENYYDVILMDINMPGISGREAIRTIRSMNRKDSDLPIIAMTADIDVANGQKNDALSAKINACLMKPYCIEDIECALLKCLE